jgi:hypothetical protein
VARDEDGGSLLLCFMLCTRKVEGLCIWIYVVIFDTIAMMTIFCTVVLSVIQGVALNTGVLPFSKGRALHVSRQMALPLAYPDSHPHDRPLGMLITQTGKGGGSNAPFRVRGPTQQTKMVTIYSRDASGRWRFPKVLTWYGDSRRGLGGLRMCE